MKNFQQLSGRRRIGSNFSSDGGDLVSEPPVYLFIYLFIVFLVPRRSPDGTHSLVPRHKFRELAADFKFKLYAAGPPGSCSRLQVQGGHSLRSRSGHSAAGTHSLVPRLKCMELVADFKLKLEISLRVPCVKIIGEDARTRCYDISWENIV
jgi:hypothetical protein